MNDLPLKTLKIDTILHLSCIYRKIFYIKTKIL